MGCYELRLDASGTAERMAMSTGQSITLESSLKYIQPLLIGTPFISVGPLHEVWLTPGFSWSTASRSQSSIYEMKLTHTLFITCIIPRPSTLMTLSYRDILSSRHKVDICSFRENSVTTIEWIAMKVCCNIHVLPRMISVVHPTYHHILYQHYLELISEC